MAVNYKMKICRGKKCKLFVDDIFALEWIDTKETLTRKDPIHNVKVDYKWYTIEDNGTTYKFAFAEVAPDQYMFLYE